MHLTLKPASQLNKAETGVGLCRVGSTETSRTAKRGKCLPSKRSGQDLRWGWGRGPQGLSQIPRARQDPTGHSPRPPCQQAYPSVSPGEF